MNDSYPQKFIDRINQYKDYTFVQYMVENYPMPTLDAIDKIVSQAWDNYINPNSFAWTRMRFFTLKNLLATTNYFRSFADGNQSSVTLCDAIAKHIVRLLQENITPFDFEPNWTDPEFTFILKDYCLSQEDEDGPSHSLSDSYWDETQCKNVEKTIIPHLTKPFIFMLLRYTYYHTIVQRMVSDEEYRRSIGFNMQFDFTQVTKVNWGKYSPREVCEQYAITWVGGGLYEIIDARAYDVKKQADVPHEWYLTLVENEGRRLREDYAYLQKHFNRRFVASLMEWHQFYFDYLVECLHNCEEYKNYPIEYLVPALQLEKTNSKPKIVNENKALTDVGRNYRRTTIPAMIQACKTAADYGRLLYRLQYELKYFTANSLSRNDYYLAMQQIGKVTFGSPRDFSNCNKGYYQARKEAAKR